MATFLVDYENVFAHVGLKGVQYLKDTDSVIIFYSNTCNNIRQNDMNAILESGCNFKTYKLVRQIKNGLDFYIASEAGMLADRGENQIAIISNDNGFTAVHDFLKMKHPENEYAVVKAPSIETAITLLNSPFDAARRTKILSDIKMLNLGEESARYEERNAYKRRIEKLLLNTEYEDRTNEIIQYASGHLTSGNKTLYTSSLHNFGSADGRAIYHLLKDAI